MHPATTVRPERSALRRPLLFALFAAGAVLPLTGCPLLVPGSGGDDGDGGLGGPSMPEVSLQQVRLTQAPGEVQVASWLCHDELNDLGDVLCDGLFGAAPSLDPNNPHSLRFSFDLIFSVTNPNDFAIPLVEMLLELAVYSGKVQRDLGAMCITFCDPAAGDNCNLHAAGGCRTDQFPEGGTAGLQIDPQAVIDELISLVTDDPAQSQSEPANQWIRTLPAGGSTQVTVSVTIGAAAMLDLIRQVVFSETNWEQMTQGNLPDVKIPYSVKGYLWFDIGDLGRVWLAFGPLGGSWDLLRGQ